MPGHAVPVEREEVHRTAIERTSLCERELPGLDEQEGPESRDREDDSRLDEIVLAHDASDEQRHHSQDRDRCATAREVREGGEVARDVPPAPFQLKLERVLVR